MAEKVKVEGVIVGVLWLCFSLGGIGAAIIGLMVWGPAHYWGV